MSVKYICKRCNSYETSLAKDLYKHLCKKNKCPRNKESYQYSDDQLLLLTLFPYCNNKHSITENEIDFLSNSESLYDNLDEFINNLIKAHKNKSRLCILCNEKFSKMTDLRKHITLSCFYNQIQNRNLNKDKNNNELNNINIDNSKIDNLTIDNSTKIDNSTIDNSTNINNTTNINNNIYLDIKQPIPFDDKWDLSLIDRNTKYFLVFNHLMYSSFLDEILKNNNNLNVIIDQKSDSGIVYKNKDDEYIIMKIKDIVNETMEKIKDQLLDMNKELEKDVFKETNTYQRRMITKKYLDYTKDKDLQDNVVKCLSNVYYKHKEEAIKISKQI